MYDGRASVCERCGKGEDMCVCVCVCVCVRVCGRRAVGWEELARVRDRVRGRVCVGEDIGLGWGEGVGEGWVGVQDGWCDAGMCGRVGLGVCVCVRAGTRCAYGRLVVRGRAGVRGWKSVWERW